jgi:hypothetical protein
MSTTDNSSTDQAPVVTDMGFAINKIAEANNQIRAKEASIGDLATKESELKAEIEALEKNKKNLEKENFDKYESIKAAEARKAEQTEAATENLASEHESLETERASMIVEREALQKEKDEVEAIRSEAERLRVANEQTSGELESKILESKRFTESRDDQLAAIEAERVALETEKKKTAQMKEETEKLVLENQTILERIKEAQDNSQVTFDLISKERTENERIKTIAQNEIASADFIKNEAYRMTMIFRQALHTYLSVNGTEVRIPELTEAHMVFVAKELIAQCPSFDMKTEFPEYFPKEVEEESTEKSTAPATPNWSKMSKPKLVEEGKTLFNLDLDIEKTQKELIAELEAAKTANELEVKKDPEVPASTTITE